MRIFRIAVGLLGTAALAFLTLAAWACPVRPLRNRAIRRLRRLWAHMCLRLLRVTVRLEPPDADLGDPALYVANHTGYLDVLVLLSIVPGVFISREGVKWWPIIGQLTVLAGTLHVDRRDRLGIGRFVDRARRRLRRGSSIVFFPEGTSTNGDGLLPFKTPLFAAATDKDGFSVPVRPLVLRYLSIGGQPVTAANRDRIFWYGDMTLGRHLWRTLKAPRVEVLVKALPGRHITTDRRSFAAALHQEMLREIQPAGTAG